MARSIRFGRVAMMVAMMAAATSVASAQDVTKTCNPYVSPLDPSCPQPTPEARACDPYANPGSPACLVLLKRLLPPTDASATSKSSSCELTIVEVVVGRTPEGPYQLAYLTMVNRDQAPAKARITFFVLDGRELYMEVDLPRGRTTFEVHKVFEELGELDHGIIPMSINVAFSTPTARAGIAHRLSTELWRTYSIGELTPCSVPPAQ